MFAAFVPSKPRRRKPGLPSNGAASGFPETPRLSDAQQAVLAMAAILFRVEAEAAGRFRVVRDAAALQHCIEQGVLAAVLHIEGAEAIDPELTALEVFYQAGLRSLGPVWSRPNSFGHGVPFRFPSSPDTGPGLTEHGRALVRACNQLGIVIDLSHITAQGFWDVARLSQAPLVATHSNAHAICPVSRNLTDAQLHAIRETDGMVGLNFAVCFLREDGENSANTPLATLVRHLDHLIEQAGEDRVGLGSDFDGATVPQEIGDVAGLPRLIEALRQHGYDQPLIEKICWRNWLRVLAKTWRA